MKAPLKRQRLQTASLTRVLSPTVNRRTTRKGVSPNVGRRTTAAMTKELTLALIFLLTHYVCPVTEAQVVTFPRCNSDKLTLEFVYANPAHDPYDLFASTRKSTCGKRAATINGSGSYADPYVISVDLSRGLMAQTPDCGVVQTGPNRFRLTVRAVFSCEAPTVNDTDYTAECDLTLPTPTTDTPASAPWASYTCRAPSTIVFTVYHAAATPPFDIYAVGKELTCSLSGGQGTGTGTEADPFTLHIDVSDTVNNCGVTTNGTDTYSVVMYVQKLADIITSADTAYALTCNFTSLSNQIISSATQPVSSNIPVGVASQNQPSASLFVLSSSPSSSAAAVLSSFAVGDPIRLAANLLDGPASGLRVRQCTASPGPGLTPRLPILDDTGCSSGNGLVPPFVVQGPSGAQAVTDSFQAFKFTSYDTIFFQCVADFCYGDNDLACLGSHCHNKRRKRGTDLVTSDAFASSVITAYVTVRSDVPANLTGFTKSGSQQDNSVCWTRNYIVAIASLAPICAAFVLLSIALGIRIVSMTTRGSNNLDSHAHLAKSEASTLASRESWHGGIILQYRPPALSAH